MVQEFWSQFCDPGVRKVQTEPPHNLDVSLIMGNQCDKKTGKGNGSYYLGFKI